MTPPHTEGMKEKLFDRRGIPIERGDVLKVFHFTGRRRRKYFMFKQSLCIVTCHRAGTEHFMKFSHLNMTDEYYCEACRDEPLEAYEIVQSIDCKHEERPRALKSRAALGEKNG